MKPKTALVTGATGFIGHHLSRRLRKEGIYVIGVSRAKVVSPDADEWLKCDLTNAEQVEETLAKAQPDYLFHLASCVVGARDVGLVRQTFNDNLVTTLNLLIAAHNVECGKVILTGSLEEPQPDSHWPVPSSPYAAAKLAASAYGRMFYSLYDLPVVTLRLFMVYGPEQRDIKKLIPYTILSLRKNESPHLSHGDRLVDWVYVDDVVDAFLACVDKDSAYGETIDIGTGLLTSVRDVAKLIEARIPSSAEVEFGSIASRKNEQVRAANIELANNVLGWSPKTPLHKGLSMTIDSFNDI